VLALVAAVGMATSSGCYAYVPVSPSQGPQRLGASVRVTLTAAGTEDLARFLGPRVHSFDGSVASINADGDPAIAVTWVQLVDGTRQPWMGQGVVTAPAADVADVAVHTLDRGRSYVAAALVGIALGAIAYAAIQGGGGNIRDNPGDGNPLTTRLPAPARPH
jgi:hypothetical protein